MMGKVIMSGIVPPLVAPISGILASDLAVGSVVKLMEGGVATEYLVVNQGKPSGSSLYDDSCDGLWLLRKDIYNTVQWDSKKVNSYKDSTIRTHLNSTFLNRFDADTQAKIKNVKIPYVNGTGNSAVDSGANGLDAKIFLLSGYEVGFGQSLSSKFPIDGAKLDYFEFGNTVDVAIKRIAYWKEKAKKWPLRSPHADDTSSVWCVGAGGGFERVLCEDQNGIRPALVLPSNSLFDTNTLILKGVA